MKKFKKIKLIVIAILVVIFAAGTYALAVNFYIIGSSKPNTLTAEQTKELTDVDCVLVLGCGIRADGTPSHMLYERLKQGANVMTESGCKALLLSGDNSGESYNELAVMKEYSLKNGIDSDKIIIDDFGFSTYESIYNAREKFGAKKIIIITQSYHLPRALYIAKSLGVEAYGVAAWLPFYPAQIIWSGREVLARNKDFLKCMVDGI